MLHRIIVSISLLAILLFGSIPELALAQCVSTPQAITNAGTYVSLDGVGGTSATDVWAVGEINAPDSVTTLIEHWNGTAWTVVPSPSVSGAANYLSAVASISVDDAWAAGTYYVPVRFGRPIPHSFTEHWNGSAWSIVHGNVQKYLTAAASGAGKAWVVGTFTQYYCRQPLGCGSAPVADYWNGKAWKSTSPQNPRGASGFQGVLALPNGNVWAVGAIDGAHAEFPLVERWSSGSWAIESAGVFKNATLTSISGTGDDDIWVSGSEKFVPVVEHWNGSTWTGYKITQPGAALLNGVVELSPDDVWVGGAFEPEYSSNSAVTLLEHWDGSAWTPVYSASGGLYSRVAAMTGVGSGVWAVGTGYTASADGSVQLYNGLTSLSHC